MKKLSITVNSDGRVSANGFAGFTGEHNSAEIEVSFVGEVPQVQYFRMYFETADGKNVFSENLQITDGCIRYKLPFDITTLSHNLYWQLCGFSHQDNVCTLLYKTEVLPIALGGSISTDGESVSEQFITALEVKLNKVEQFVDDVAEIKSNFKYIKRLNVVINSADWNKDSMFVLLYNDNIKASDFLIVKPSTLSEAEYNRCNVKLFFQSDGSLGFSCSEIPSINLTLDVLVVSA